MALTWPNPRAGHEETYECSARIWDEASLVQAWHAPDSELGDVKHSTCSHIIIIWHFSCWRSVHGNKVVKAINVP